MNVGLRGVIPGEPTERELRTKLLQCKFWGGACLCVLAVAAQLYDMACVQVRGVRGWVGESGVGAGGWVWV
mgnify:CR=1 FL=1